MIPEREREALMRLTMCAREECRICKYEDTCNFTFQCDLATENMNILADALRVADTPQTDCEIPKNALRSACTGCRFVGTYDTQFPCANCARKDKDYYDSEYMEGSR